MRVRSAKYWLLSGDLFKNPAVNDTGSCHGAI